MIERLHQAQLAVAREIYLVFQLSYAIEAKLLNAINFPPLERSINDIMASRTQFYGYRDSGQLKAVVELSSNAATTHIQSLVVRPECFRQGIGSALIRFVLRKYDSKTFTVETGLANDPATKLYERFGFKAARQWNTDHGVRKIAYKLQREK